MRRRALHIVISLVVGVITLAIVAVFVISNTDWGRERVRQFALGALESEAAGIVRIGAVRGNLLTGARLVDVSITDSAGRPFLAVDSLRAGYSIRTLLRRRIYLNDVVLYRPIIVLDQRPGEDWNFSRIFQRDTAPPADEPGQGFGTWVELQDVALHDGHVTVRREWQPDASMPEREQALEIGAALAGETRMRVERVPGGLQSIMDFRQVNAELPLIRVADPDSVSIRLDIARLAMIAEPFNPPVADVRDLRGTVVIVPDSVFFRDLDVALPGSRLVASGSLGLGDESFTLLSIRGAPVALADLQWLYPAIPTEGGGSLDFQLAMRGDTGIYLARNADLRIGASRLAGDFGIEMTERVVFRDTDLRVTNFDTRLIEQLAPDVEVPRHGTLTGRAAIAGPLTGLSLNADLAFTEPASGTSRVVAVGEVGMLEGGGIRASGLRLEFSPLQVDLARIAVPDLPIGGTLTGTANLDGSTHGRIGATVQLTHTDRGAVSRVRGTGAVTLAGAQRVDVDLQLQPLSLVTVGRFAPAARLHGTAAGRLRANGWFRDIDIDADLRFADGGALIARGNLNIASEQPGYSMTVGLELFNAQAVVQDVPPTTITAASTLRGRGTDPATMRAVLGVEATTFTVDELALEGLLVRAEVGGGLLRVDSVHAEGAFGSVAAAGTLGMVEQRSGTLTYRIAVDSLNALAAFIPGLDTGEVEPRSRQVQRAFAQARADSAAIAAATEVERMVTGAPGPALVVDTSAIRPIPRDTVGGRIYAAGVITGSLARFDLRGRAALEQVVVGGNAVQRGRVEYGWFGAMDTLSTFAVGARLDSVRAAGFALDSVDARIGYTAPRGEVQFLINQEEGISYDGAAQFTLLPEANELILQSAAFRFDTISWVATQPGSIRWNGAGIEVDSISLVSGNDGRIFLDGTIATEAGASSDLDVAIAGLELAHISALLQGDVGVSGVLTVTAGLSGPAESPTMQAAVGVAQFGFRGSTLPDVRGTFGYANRTLRMETQWLRPPGEPVMRIDGTLPLDLALAGEVQERLPDGPLDITIVGDSIPLDVIPRLLEDIDDLRGGIVGAAVVRGTLRDPQIVGRFDVDLASFRIVPQGVRIADINGTIRIRNDSLYIDSIVGHAGGPLSVSGTLGLATLTAPSFDLRVRAQDAWVLDTELGRLRADAALQVRGPFDRVEVTGTSRIRSGVFYVPAPGGREVLDVADSRIHEVVGPGEAGDEDLIPETSPLLENLLVDVMVGIDRDVWARNNEANIELFTPAGRELSIYMDNQRDLFIVDGVINTDRGEYSFLGRRFLVSRGSITFIGDPDLNPLLQISAIREVQIAGREALEIRVTVGGTLRDPAIGLESNAQPPISQSDLISYLAFGRSSTSLLEGGGTSSLGGGSTGSGGVTGAARAYASQGLASLALGALAQQIEVSATRSMGLDVVNVTPGDTDLESLLSPTRFRQTLEGFNLELGKYVDRGTFVAVQSPASLSRPGIRVERRLWGGYRIEGSIAPRFIVRQPTLVIPEEEQTRRQTVFGAFLIREWRF